MRGFRRGRTGIVKAVTVLPFRQTNFFKRNFEKPLDKPLNLCYNTDTKQGETQAKVKKKILKKRKKVLDKHRKV